MVKVEKLSRIDFPFLKSFNFRHKGLIWPFWFWLLILPLLFLPGNSYYETLDLSLASSGGESDQKMLPPLPAVSVKTLSGDPEINARAILLADYDSGQILYQKNIDQPLPLASLTKIMTALVVLEEIPGDQVLTVGDISIDGQTVGLLPGEQFRVSDLLYGLLVMSGNDVAQFFAQSYPGGETAFVSRMNEMAQELGLEKTNFANPHGFDDPNHYSSARDLFRLTSYALKNSAFVDIVKTGSGQICSLVGNNCHPIEPTNELLTYPGILGVKTGWTTLAGGCFIGFWQQGNRRFISVILGSDDRFAETKTLLNWSLASFSQQEISLLTLLE